MKKVLVIVSHPNIQTSMINKRWVDEVKKYPELFTVNELYKAYPDWNINVEKEQELIENHTGIIFQFPLYWYNSPPLLKKWLDDVFTYGWAYGSKGTKLKSRKIGVAVSVGNNEIDYTQNGRYGHTLSSVLKSFEFIAYYTKAEYQPLFAFYGANNEPEVGAQYTLADLDNSAENYIKHLKKFL